MTEKLTQEQTRIAEDMLDFAAEYAIVSRMSHILHRAAARRALDNPRDSWTVETRMRMLVGRQRPVGPYMPSFRAVVEGIEAAAQDRLQRFCGIEAQSFHEYPDVAERFAGKAGRYKAELRLDFLHRFNAAHESTRKLGAGALSTGWPRMLHHTAETRTTQLDGNFEVPERADLRAAMMALQDARKHLNYVPETIDLSGTEMSLA